MNSTWSCEYDHDGYDTDGTEWFRCTVHDELAPGNEAPCAGWVAPPYKHHDRGL